MTHDENKPEALKSGTTIVGIKTNDFVILASDKQSTMGYTKSNLEVQKLFPITNNLVLAIAGSVGDAQQVIRVLKMQASIYENERNKRMNANALMTLTSNVLNSNRYYPYMVGFIVCGFVDKPELLETDAYGGMQNNLKLVSIGSGSSFATSILDKGYKEKMTKEEAIALVCDAINASKKRDIFTGGENIDIYFINKHGMEFIRK